MFNENIAEIAIDEEYRKRKDYQADVRSFVAEYKDVQFFAHVPGRNHPSFPTFDCDMKLENPDKLKARLVTYNKKLDWTRLVLS